MMGDGRLHVTGLRLFSVQGFAAPYMSAYTKGQIKKWQKELGLDAGDGEEVDAPDGTMAPGQEEEDEEEALARKAALKRLEQSRKRMALGERVDPPGQPLPCAGSPKMWTLFQWGLQRQVILPQLRMGPFGRGPRLWRSSGNRPKDGEMLERWQTGRCALGTPRRRRPGLREEETRVAPWP